MENRVEGISREEMEKKLKVVISHAVESNTLNTVGWANLPLPQYMILNERTKAAQMHQNPPWGNGLVPLNLRETNRNSTDVLPKKRKSPEPDPQRSAQEKVPPWRLATNNQNVFEDRVSLPDKRHRNDATGKGSSKSHHDKASRKKRFEDGHSTSMSRQPFMPSKANVHQPDENQGPVIGRCQDLEKKYFRLTSAPNPDTVRPLPVLEKTLDLLKKKWKKENNYSYICDQFKSLRQDLTVQHIKTDFTVNVYEIHARIALEKGDLGEYNQCQTQLRALHSQHLGGHPEEFKAYRILYFIHTCNRTDMNDVLADLMPEEKKDPAVQHALETRSALALGNYHRFFQLYLDTPNMGAYLMDMFVARERLAALSNVCISYVALSIFKPVLTATLGISPMLSSASLPRSSDSSQTMRAHVSYVTIAVNHSSKNVKARCGCSPVKLYASLSLLETLRSRKSTSRAKYKASQLSAHPSLHFLPLPQPLLHSISLRASSEASVEYPDSSLLFSLACLPSLPWLRLQHFSFAPDQYDL